MFQNYLPFSLILFLPRSYRKLNLRIYHLLVIAKIKEKKEVVRDTLSVEFDLLGKKLNFLPGQYITVRLLGTSYKDEKGNERDFSINNPPSENRKIVITTRIRDSAFKKSLREMPVGSDVELNGPNGSFVLPKDNLRPLIFIAGGIGITPFLSMLRHVRDKNLHYNIALMYSNKNRKSSAYFEELQKMEKDYKNFKFIPTMTEDEVWQGERGRIDALFIKKHIPDLNSCIYFVAGPPQMVSAITVVLGKAGVSSGNIKTENFTGY